MDVESSYRLLLVASDFHCQEMDRTVRYLIALMNDDAGVGGGILSRHFIGSQSINLRSKNFSRDVIKIIIIMIMIIKTFNVQAISWLLVGASLSCDTHPPERP